MHCLQECDTSADEWASTICSSVEGASHNEPRGKHARHADVIRLVHIISSSLDSVLTSVRELSATGQLRITRRENSEHKPVVTDTHLSASQGAR